MHTIIFKKIIDSGYDIGLHEYPVFDDDYRDVLNQKIIDRYLFNEIGFETPQRFIHELNTRLKIIMPKYNDILSAYTELQKIGFGNLLRISIGNQTDRITHTITDDFTTNKTDNTDTKNSTLNASSATIYGKNSTSTQTGDSQSINLNSDTPQSLSQIDFTNISNWKNSPYVSNASYSRNNDGTNTTTDGGTDTTNTNSTQNDTGVLDGLATTDFDGDQNTVENIIHSNYDYMNTYKKIIDTIDNIDERILRDLRDLFLTVY